MTLEKPQFSLEKELNKLGGFTFEPVPSDKKINAAIVQNIGEIPQNNTPPQLSPASIASFQPEDVTIHE